MFRLYLRKLFLIIGFFFAIIVVFFPCFLVTSTIANFFENPVIHSMILMGVPTFIVLRYVYKSRVRNHSLRIDYLNYIRRLDAVKLKDKIKNEILYLKSFQQLQAEILAFATIMLPFVMEIGVTSDNGAPFFAKVFAGIIMFSMFVGGYLILDVLFWMFVHKKWLK